jgi:hypothetical protein
MKNYECHYLNTWPFGLNPKVKAHIVNKFNYLVAKVLNIELKDAKLPENASIPILIREQVGQIIEAVAFFNNKKWFIRIEVENLK